MVPGELARSSDSCVESRDIRDGAGMYIESRPRIGVLVPSGERYESRGFGSGDAVRLLRSGEATSGLGTAEYDASLALTAGGFDGDTMMMM